MEEKVRRGHDVEDGGRDVQEEADVEELEEM